MAERGKRPDMLVHGEEPYNAETAPAALVASALTPVDAFYARNHAPVPEAPDPDAWRLRVEGLVERPQAWSVAELRERFAEHEVVATLQCAGNRRQALLAVRPIEGEVGWHSGAIGTAAWRGAALADVLAAAGPRSEARFAGFEGADPSAELDPPERYGGSIPLAKARRPEVLLAWSMNGAPLTPLHGGPLRVVVPGYIGARSVKWVERVELRTEPWDGHYQAVAYRLLPPDGRAERGAGMELGETPLNAEVMVPAPGDVVPARGVEVLGWAAGGEGRTVERVDVSADGGATWRQAELLDDLGPWAWRRWRARVELAPGEHELVARAWDSTGATQPEHAAPLWNPKGYVNTAWGRVRVTAQA